MKPMNYSVEYRSNKESTILIRTFSGVVKMADVISSWDYVLSKHLLKKEHKGVISDYRGSDLIVGIEDVVKLKEFLCDNPNTFKTLKLAQVIDTTIIVFPILFVDKYPEILSKPFSTIEAAEMWIMI